MSLGLRLFSVFVALTALFAAGFPIDVVFVMFGALLVCPPLPFAARLRVDIFFVIFSGSGRLLERLFEQRVAGTEGEGTAAIGESENVVVHCVINAS